MLTAALSREVGKAPTVPVFAVALALSAIVVNTLLAVTAVAVSPVYKLVARRSKRMDGDCSDHAFERPAADWVVIHRDAVASNRYMLITTRGRRASLRKVEEPRTLH
jgi:hypothetical protein